MDFVTNTKAKMMMLLEGPKNQPNSLKEGIDSHKIFIQLNMNTQLIEKYFSLFTLH